ncbi:MAG: hypothetical protein QOC83_6714, partial [Pseudonocardiales bacterium]|nr:hypothetical protein [Pseudonocardiales bacterium]
RVTRWGVTSRLGLGEEDQPRDAVSA